LTLGFPAALLPATLERKDDVEHKESGGAHLEPLPDFSTLSDDDLNALIDRLEKEENRVSYERRLLQGKIDILRGERTARMKGQSVGEVDVDQLADILSSRRTPDVNAPTEDAT
jgi:hypothetical protein